MDKFKNPNIEVNTIVYYLSSSNKEDTNTNKILFIKRGDEGKLSLPFKLLQYNIDPLDESKAIANDYFNDLEPQTTFFTVRGDHERDSAGHIVAFVYSIQTSSGILKDNQPNKTAQLYSFANLMKMDEGMFYNDHLDILNQFIQLKRN